MAVCSVSTREGFSLLQIWQLRTAVSSRLRKNCRNTAQHHASLHIKTPITPLIDPTTLCSLLQLTSAKKSNQTTKIRWQYILPAATHRLTPENSQLSDLKTLLSYQHSFHIFPICRLSSELINLQVCVSAGTKVHKMNYVLGSN